MHWRLLAILGCASVLIVPLVYSETSQPTAPPRNSDHYQSGYAAARYEHDQSDQSETLWQKITGEPVAFTTLCLTGVTGILAVSTIGLWIVTGTAGRRQSIEMGRHIAEASRAAKAMEGVAAGIVDSVSNTKAFMEQQRRYSQMQLRPYIAIVDPAFIPQNMATPYFTEIQLNIINTGHTPAHNIRIEARLDVLPSILPPDFSYPITDRIHVGGGAHMNPGQRMYFRRNVGRLIPPMQYFNVIRGTGDRRLYIYGTINFDDVFGDSHYTNFCSFGMWDNQLRFSTMNTAEHNDAT